MIHYDFNKISLYGMNLLRTPHDLKNKKRGVMMIVNNLINSLPNNNSEDIYIYKSIFIFFFLNRQYFSIKIFTDTFSAFSLGFISIIGTPKKSILYYF